MTKPIYFALMGLLAMAAGCAPRYTDYSEPPTYSTATYPTSERVSAEAKQAAEDAALEQRVRDQFRHYNLSAFAQAIDIDAREGHVTLKGSVPSHNEREMIGAMVRNTPGVEAVNNELQTSTRQIISSPNTQAYPSADNRALAASVQRALQRQPVIAPFASNIRVSADNGIVTLAGTVPTETDRQFVENVVRNTPGVTGLVDQMRVSTTPTGRLDEPSPRYAGDMGQLFSLNVQGLNETDRATAQRILQGLRTDTVLPSLLPVVSINVADGRVTLRGTVQNDEQRRAIVSAVQRAAGVDAVHDELQVTGAR